MAENTNKNIKNISSLEPTRLSSFDELESAKILFQEGLFEEAKKKLHQILIVFPNFKIARALLEKIHAQEEKILLQGNPKPSSVKTKKEDAYQILKKLEFDLGIELDLDTPFTKAEQWVNDESLDPKEHYDLGVAFFEMECFSDAIRELRKAERKIRQERTFLGELGVSIVALIAESQFKSGRSFEAKSFLEPILNEPDLKHEEKIILFYLMGVIEAELGHAKESNAWLQQVISSDPHFRDAKFRLNQKT